MFWILITVVAVIAGAVWFSVADDIARQQKASVARFRLIPIVVLATLWVLASSAFSVHTVDARNVGIVRTFGSITGQIGEGFQLTWPWQTVEEWEVRTQALIPLTSCSNGERNCMNAGSVDIQDVYIKATVNLNVDATDIQRLAREVGPNYKESIVFARLEQVTKAIISTYKAENILENREVIRQAIVERMRAEMAEYSIRVDDVLLNDIDFTREFKDSVEAKVRAEQEALTEQNRVAIARARAEQAEAEAVGRANAIVAEAQGQAEANRLINESITPNLIQWQAVQKLSDNIQIALIPSGQGIIIDPATLLSPQP